MSQQIFNLLVPYDFSEQSYTGLVQAKHIADNRPVKVTVLHVINENAAPWNIFTSEHKKFFKEKFIEAIHLLSKEPKTAIKNFEVILETGKLTDVILQTAEKLNMDCILIGTNAGDVKKRKIMGSNALKIVNESTIPVITVKKGCEYSDLTTIVLPLDLEKETREKVPVAVKMAKLFNAKIKIVSLVSTNDEHVNANLQNQGRQVLDFVKQRDVDATLDIIKYEGTSRRQRMKEYFEANKGLAIITTNQQPEIIDFFIGSFASDLIQLAPIPVMSIAPQSVFKYNLEMPGIR